MKYSLTPYSQTVSNTTEGDIELTTDEVIVLTNSTFAQIEVPSSGTTSGTLVLDCDLGSRVHTDEIQYYFASPVSGTEIIPYIEFSVKNESFETYISLDTYYTGAYYYATISGTDSPRFIRVYHTVVSGYGGLVNGFKVINDDTYVDFGEDGTQESHNVNLSIEDAIIEINEMEVFNSSPDKANAKLILEPQNDVSDNVFSISTSADGPWYGIYQEDDKIAGSDLWETGTQDDLQVVSEVLKLEGGKTVGTYTTRIFELDNYQRLTFNMMDYDYPIVTSEIVFFDDFSEGDANWEVTYTYTWTPDAGYTHNFNNEIAYYRYYNALGGNNVIFFTTKDLSYDYGDDWQLNVDFLYSNWESTGGGVGLIIYPLHPQSDFYFRVVIDDATGTGQMVVNGTAYDLGSVTDWVANMGTWFRLKLQRNFTAINLKIWERAEPEPEAWSWNGSVSPEDLLQVAGIRITDHELETAAGGGDYVRIDNFVVIKNASATNDAKSIIATTDYDTFENIEVRSSNSYPAPRTTYVEMTGSYAASSKYTQHRWMADGTVAELSSDWGTWGQTSNFWEYWFDSEREDEYIVDKPFYTAGNTQIYFRIRRKDGTLYSTTISNADYDADRYYSTYKLSPNEAGGFWIYFFLASTDINTGTYYLRYYSNTMGLEYNKTADGSQGTFLYDLDSVYGSSGQMWYTDRDNSTVFKVDSSGDILASYLAVEDIRGIVSDDEGGCWFIQQQALIHIDSNANYLSAIELPTDTASYVYSNYAGGFWIQDGWVIRHLDSSGTETFNVEIENLYFIVPAKDGVMTKQHDGSSSTLPKASFISTEYKKVTRTWDYPRTETGYKGTFDYNRYGVRSHLYDDLESDHASNFPIAIDAQWNAANWIPVSLRDYNFTNEEYHQIRFTLRADTSNNSPEVYGIYTQRAIEIPDVYPGNYGTFYLKSELSGVSYQDAGNYTSNIRAYWFIYEE